MLEMRDQNIKIEMEKARMQAKQMEAMSNQMMAASQQIAKGIESGRMEGMYNTLMQEQYAPRAQAVNPAMQAPADQIAAAAPSPFGPGFLGGGKAEFDMRMKMDELRSQNMARSSLSDYRTESLGLKQEALGLQEQRTTSAIENAALRGENTQSQIEARNARLALAQDAAVRAEEDRRVQDALAAQKVAGDDYNKAQTGMTAYNKAVSASVPSMKRALQIGGERGEQLYNDALANIESHRQGAMANKVKFDTPPEFPSYQDALAVQEKQKAVTQYGQAMTGMTGAELFHGAAYEQEKLSRMESELQQMPGYQQMPQSPDRYMATNPLEAPRQLTYEELQAIRKGQATPGQQSTPQTMPAPQSAPGAQSGGQAATSGGGVISMSAADFKNQFGINVRPGQKATLSNGQVYYITP